MSNKLLPCPFCGGKASLSTVGRSWYRVTADHDECCILEEHESDCPQTDEQLQLLLRDWNTRAAPVVEHQDAIGTLRRVGQVIVFDAIGDPHIRDGMQVFTEPQSPASVVTREQVEIVAESIYWQWACREGFVPWVTGGNSLKQDEARSIAWSTLDKVKEPNP